MNHVLNQDIYNIWIKYKKSKIKCHEEIKRNIMSNYKINPDEKGFKILYSYYYVYRLMANLNSKWKMCFRNKNI